MCVNVARCDVSYCGQHSEKFIFKCIHSIVLCADLFIVEFEM